MNSDTNTDKNDGMLSHLGELRSVLIRSILIISVGTLVCWLFDDLLFSIVRSPISAYLGTDTRGLIYTGVTDKFFAHMKIALLGGVIFTCPFWIYQVWNFISPGLYKNERQITIFFVGFGSFLFLLGILFVYFVIYPIAFKFLLNFGDGKDIPMISINHYLSFFTTTVLIFGLAFELPLVLTGLSILGIVDKKFLKKNRGYAYIILACISSFATPPDVVSMLFFMIPMILLYEISVLFTAYIPRMLGIP